MPIEADGLRQNDGANLRGFDRKFRFIVVIADDKRCFKIRKILNVFWRNNVAAMDDLVDAMSFENVQGRLNCIIVIMRITDNSQGKKIHREASRRRCASC